KEFEDPREGIDLLGKGVELMQARVSPSPCRSSSREEESFQREIESLFGKSENGPLPAKAPEAEEQASNPLPDPLQDVGLLRDFISEAMEHLESIELNIINLEQSPDDKEYLNAIFRPFHTIKGVSGFLNLKEINRFTHAVESLLDDVRSGALKITREMIDFVLEAVDLLKSMILDLKAHVDSNRTGFSQFELEPYLDRIAFLQKREGEAGAVRRDGSGDSPPLGEILASKGIVSEKDISEALEDQRKGQSQLRIGEILVRENKARPKQVIEALREQKEMETRRGESAVKVDTQKLDNLIDMVGELVIAQSLIQQNPVFSSIHDQKLNRDLSHLRRITTDLQKTSMALRMIPIRQTFQRMIRLVRDLAKKSGKRADLVMSGEETEIDRNMVEALSDPLVHLIRNAVDHGIEMPEKRKEAGKPANGQIALRAYQKGGHIVIEVEDDGQGLNHARILKKARDRGLVPEDAVLTPPQTEALIFEAGFSTVEQVSEISGRGVGMDVVKKAIEKLRGKIEVSSAEGKGCRFVMRVPLTLAIMDGIIVRVGGERYIIPAVFIKETLRPRREEVTTIQNKGDLIKVRNSLLPLIRLHHLLGVDPLRKEPWEGLAVVVENDGSQKALMIDELLGNQEVVIKNLGERLKTVEGVAGATIMGDGQVGLILDVHGIFQIDQTS
ncbi:MAG: chemotaxis protein CheA, partial [Deltaproteobacteria bacterium]